jgi:polyisoprenoid-binding protein YceI
VSDVRRALVVAALVATLVAALVSACAPQGTTPILADEQIPAGFPEQYYQQAIERRRPVFRVDPARSLVVVEVRRGGSLARLGHDHVVASHDVRGYVAPEDGRADLYVELARLVVDEPGLRAEAGFDTQPSPADVAGTRQNMLEKVFEVAQHPFALISVTGGDAVDHGQSLNVAITLHGVTRALQVPAKVESATDAFDVTGELALAQSDFGIVPFSILGGAIQVLDKVNLRFRIRARRIALGV